MVCPKCGKPNSAEYLFCMSCGTELQEITEEHLTDWTAPIEPAPPASTPLPPVRFIGFGESVRNFFKNYANFKGRATRAEYWFGTLFTALCEFVIIIILGLFIPLFSDSHRASIFAYITTYAVMLPLVCPTYALIWRRLHDTGHSGAIYFLGLIPIANLIVAWWIAFASSVGDNKYGPRKIKDPLGSPCQGSCQPRG